MEYDVAVRCKDSLVGARAAVCASHRVLPNKQEFIACLAKSIRPPLYVEFLLLLVYIVRKRLISLCKRRYRSSFLWQRQESTFCWRKQRTYTAVIAYWEHIPISLWQLKMSYVHGSKGSRNKPKSQRLSIKLYIPYIIENWFCKFVCSFFRPSKFTAGYQTEVGQYFDDVYKSWIFFSMSKVIQHKMKSI